MASLGRRVTCGLVVMLIASICIAAWGQGTQPWWDDYPLIVQDDNVVTALAHNGTVSSNSGLQAPSWGTYVMKATNDPSLVSAFAWAGLRTISYTEAFGQSACYLAELGTGGGEVTPILHSHWNWQQYAGGTIAWVGAQNFFDDEGFAQPYTRTHPTFGGSPMAYPDGTIASGYDGDPSDPRNSRVFDAGASKNILGGLSYEHEGPSGPPYDGCVTVGGTYASLLWIHKDSACPHWLSVDCASAKLAASQGGRGLWVDNPGPWDSFSIAPVERGFGDWSVAGFREYLSSHFTPVELTGLGVADVNTFDIRAALRAQALAWGGDDTNLSDPIWHSSAWRDMPLWRAYCIFKRQKGTEALADYYNSVKAAAAEGGQEEFFLAGNLAGYNLGWLRGDLDMVSAECSPGWSLHSGARGFLLPPAGRMTPRYNVAREHAKSRFVNVWLYFESGDGYDRYSHNPGLVNVMLYEMLAAHTLPMAFPNNPRVAGTQAIYSSFFGFVKSAKATFADRRPAADIGVYYSSSSLLAAKTPSDWANIDEQPHQFGVYGWATALGELHYQYRVVPEWKLTGETLAGLRVLIIPNAEVLDPSDVTNVLTPWVQGGGLLTVTGDSGLRLGEDDNFDLSPAGLSLAPLTGVSSMTPAPSESLASVGAGKVLYVPENTGREYFDDDANRAALLSGFSTRMDLLLSGQVAPLIAAPTVSTTVGLTAYRDDTAKRQFVDINNFGVHVSTDVVTPTGPLSFDVAVPEWLRVSDLRVSALSPDGVVPVSFVMNTPERATVTVGSVTYYASIVFDFPDADGDGLSDAQEGALGTDVDKADTDGDGITDFDEVWYDGDGGYNPYDADLNPTGTDLDACNADTDGDGVNDWAERQLGTDPLDEFDFVQLPTFSTFGLVVLAALVTLSALGLVWWVRVGSEARGLA